MGTKKLIVFTDLDGTLLDLKTYSFSGAIDALGKLRALGIPVIMASSKTRKEIELWQRRIGIEGPFIAENGGGIYLPPSFSLLPRGAKEKDGLVALDLGKPYREIRRVVEELQHEGFSIRGFGDMTSEEVAYLTQMSWEEANLAKEREFSEPCLYEGDLDALKRALEREGMTLWKGGRFIHIQGRHDKGKGMEIIEGLYRQLFGEIMIVALGDSPIDLPMLQRAHWPVVVRRPKGLSDNPPPLPSLMVTQREGSEGWGEAVEEILRRFL